MKPFLPELERFNIKRSGQSILNKIDTNHCKESIEPDEGKDQL
jgi:hypothetical protein